MKYLILLLLLLCTLQVSDGIISQSAVNADLVQEANPLIGYIIKEGNFFLFKIIGAFLCAVALWNTYRRFPKLALLATSSIVMFYGTVLAWNLYVLSFI